MDGIITPEAVVLELETAGVASRVWSGAIDFAIQLMILVLLSGVLAAAGAESGSGADTASAIAIAAVFMGYPVLFETLMRGRTPGKRIFGLRAVTIEGAPVRLRHTVLRMMGGLVDKFLPPIGVTGTLMVLGTSRHQRVGDLMAGTIVIRDPDRTLLPPAVWFPVPAGYEQFAVSIDPTALTDAQYTVVRSFLMRNRELSPEARYSLSQDLAERVGARVYLPWTPAIHPETYLLCVIARYQRRTFPQYQPTAWRS